MQHREERALDECFRTAVSGEATEPDPVHIGAEPDEELLEGRFLAVAERAHQLVVRTPGRSGLHDQRPFAPRFATRTLADGGRPAILETPYD
jgi:hypothetical protein